MLQVVQAIKAGIEDPMVPYSQFVSGFLRFLVLFHVVLLSEQAICLAHSLAHFISFVHG